MTQKKKTIFKSRSKSINQAGASESEEDEEQYDDAHKLAVRPPRVNSELYKSSHGSLSNRRMRQYDDDQS